MMMMRKLYRSNSDKMLAGVLGGIADYLDIDSTILRLIYAIVFVFTGGAPLFVLYIVAAFIMPKEGSIS